MDGNGYPNYRVIDGEMVEIPLQEKIDSVKMSKLNEFKIMCSEKFENGISIGEIAEDRVIRNRKRDTQFRKEMKADLINYYNDEKNETRDLS